MDIDSDQILFAQEAIKGDMELTNNSPIILSWGRTDLGCLFRSGESPQEIQQITFGTDRNILQLSSNSFHSVALTTTGEIYISGSNDEGEINPFDRSQTSSISRPKMFDFFGQTRISRISCGLHHTVCVTSSGNALSFGGNEAGQLGHSSLLTSFVPPKTVEFRVKSNKSVVFKDVACGDYFTLLLTSSGEVYSCGVGVAGGHRSDSNLSQLDRVESLMGLNVSLIAAGSSHALALTATGTLYGWGASQFGQLGVGAHQQDVTSSSPSLSSLPAPPDHIQLPYPIHIPDLEGQIIGVACGYHHSLVWTDTGALYGSGSNKYGQIGTITPQCLAFTRIPLPWGLCLSASCGSNHSLVLASNQLPNADSSEGEFKVFGCGSNNFGQITSSSTAPLFRTLTEISELERDWRMRKGVFTVTAGGDQSFLIGLPDLEDSSSSLLSARTAMRKQFSTQVSKELTPLDASSLQHIISSALALNQRPGGPSQRELNQLITYSCDLFSSPSLLAGSFLPLHRSPSTPPTNSNSMRIDVEGVEGCYKALLQLGSASVVRLMGALSQTLSLLLESHSSLTEGALRTLLIVWQCPVFSNAVLSGDLFSLLIVLLSKLSPSLQEVLFKAVYSYPPHIFASRILKPLQEHLTMLVESDSPPIPPSTPVKDTHPLKQIPAICDILQSLFRLNKQLERVPVDSFYNPGVSGLNDLLLFQDYSAWSQEQRQSSGGSGSGSGKQQRPSKFTLSRYSFLMSPDAKRRLIMIASNLEQQAAQQQAARSGLMRFGGFSPYFVMQIHRERLLEQSLQIISAVDTLTLKKPLKIIFEGEEGIDAGGVKKEFFQMIVSQLFSLDYGMFVPSPDGRSLWINHQCLWAEREFHLVGVLLGLAVHNGVLIDAHFPRAFYKKLLRQPTSLSDLRFQDSSLHTGLSQLLEYSPADQVEDVFCRSFEVSWDHFGSPQTHELIPDGKSQSVTGENRELYVSKLVDWTFNESVRPQFESLYSGFVRVVNPNSILLLQPEELELLMVGTPHLNFKELEESTEYISGEPGSTWGPSHPTIRAFWETVHAMDFPQKQKLLLFATGSAKAPIGGLKNLGFKIQRMSSHSQSLPTSHTCFNLLMLPEYSSQTFLKTQLLRAIEEFEGFGLK